MLFLHSVSSPAFIGLRGVHVRKHLRLTGLSVHAVYQWKHRRLSLPPQRAVSFTSRPSQRYSQTLAPSPAPGSLSLLKPFSLTGVPPISPPFLGGGGVRFFVEDLLPNPPTIPLASARL